MRISVVIPTLNPGGLWDTFSAALLENLRDLELEPSTVLILDSASNDGTAQKAAAAGFRVLSIDRASFDHGGTRQVGVQHEAASDILVFLTQDAVLADPSAIRTLLGAFEERSIGAAYGRQLPRQGARGIEAHARLFNYPAVSKVRCLEDRQELGFKSIFSSNSFCAFRREALMDVGGFPARAICSEETIAIARMHIAGWRSAYVAEAQVYHSHPFSLFEEFKRYFDVGVTHTRQPFLVEDFGTATGEGKRFVLSELRYLLRNEPQQLPTAMLRTLTKFAGYRMGRREARLSVATRRRISMNRSFWNTEARLLQEAEARAARQQVTLVQKLPRRTSLLQNAASMVPQQLQPKSELRPPTQLPTEIARVASVQQQRFR